MTNKNGFNSQNEHRQNNTIYKKYNIKFVNYPNIYLHNKII